MRASVDKKTSTCPRFMGVGATIPFSACCWEVVSFTLHPVFHAPAVTVARLLIAIASN